MTPPAASAAARAHASRRAAPSRRPRARAGPGRRRPGRAATARPRPRVAPRPRRAPGARRSRLARSRLSDHRLLDRLIRGRLWIGLVAFALIGIVAMQLLAAQAEHRHRAQHCSASAQLQRENAALSIENSELAAAGERVEPQAQPPGHAASSRGRHALPRLARSHATCRGGGCARKLRRPASEARERRLEHHQPDRSQRHRQPSSSESDAAGMPPAHRTSRDGERIQRRSSAVEAGHRRAAAASAATPSRNPGRTPQRLERPRRTARRELKRRHGRPGARLRGRRPAPHRSDLRGCFFLLLALAAARTVYLGVFAAPACARPRREQQLDRRKCRPSAARSPTATASTWPSPSPPRTSPPTRYLLHEPAGGRPAAGAAARARAGHAAEQALRAHRLRVLSRARRASTPGRSRSWR